MSEKHRTLKDMLASDKPVTLRQQIYLVLKMSLPTVMAQVTMIAMEYIDAAMVGSLGAGASASIGLVSSSTWLLGGISVAAVVGFSIQTAHRLGACKASEARDIMRQGIICCVSLSLLIGAAGAIFSPYLPVLLGGEAQICDNAGKYFGIFCCSLPLYQLRYFGSAMLQSTGNTKTPGIINSMMCFLDAFWNFLFIFPSRTVAIGSFSVFIPGAGLGVPGAALGTAVSELIAMSLIMWCLLGKSPELSLRAGEAWHLTKECVLKAVKLGFPVALENAVMCGAMVATTAIAAPLGAVAIAANSFAITAEGLCYMPGYGIASAISPIVGQSLGAGRHDLIRNFAKSAIGIGMVIMSATAVLMYAAAPWIFAILTPDQAVRDLGTRILRIEMFAEPMFAASIIAAGALRGVGDTLIPSLLNIFSIWGIRVVLCLILVEDYGLVGMWIAMCIELWCRGLFMTLRLRQESWLKKANKEQGYGI